MRDPNRQLQLLAKIRRAWLRDPDARLLQLLINALHAARTSESQLFLLEDDVLERAVDEFTVVLDEAVQAREASAKEK